MAEVSTVTEFHDVTAERFEAVVIGSGRPAVFRGLATDWPAIAAGQQSPEALADYLRRFDRGLPVGAMIGPPRIRGRFHYKEDLSGFNFRRQTVKIGGALDFLLSLLDDADPPSFAVQSAPVWQNLPGFDRENVLPLLDNTIEPRVWIGNKVVVAAHQDPSENIVCVVAGRRRFTLFPPEQIANLYMGPFEKTPAGTTISMVDFETPDLDRHPRFVDALEHAVVAELGPGDALYIPYMWWHHVRSLDPFNMLVNYWWKPPAIDRAHPMDAMLLAMLTIRELPEAHRRAWQAHFAHYVFDAGDAPAGHLPDERRGVLGPLDAEQAKGLRDAVLSGLARN